MNGATSNDLASTRNRAGSPCRGVRSRCVERQLNRGRSRRFYNRPMTTKTQVPAVPGLFTLEGPDGPQLIGGRGKGRDSYFFPKDLAGSDPGCVLDPERTEVLLSRTGTVWSFTAMNYQPPAPYPASDDYEPFVLAAVELESEQLVVLGQMVSGTDISTVAVGMRVELTVETHREDDEFEYMMWKWQPATEASSS